MFQEQQKILQQARIVQNQRLEKLRNVYKEFLKVCGIWQHKTLLENTRRRGAWVAQSLERPTPGFGSGRGS